MQNAKYIKILDTFKKKLNDRHLKFSLQREVIFKILYFMDSPVTIEELYQLFVERHPDISMSITAVYRVLWLLEEFEMVTSITFKTRSKRFELKRDTHPIYFICNQCENIYRYVDKDIQSKQKAGIQKLEFFMNSSELKIYGICKECSMKD